MRLHRFISHFDLTQKKLTVTDEELVNQWRNVLRLKTGDRLIVCDGAGMEAEATVVRMDKKEYELSVESLHEVIRGPEKKVTIYVSLLRRENFEMVVQKATEIGIARIVPLLSERTVKTGYNSERLEKIIREACEQSGRTTIPELAEATDFTEALLQVDPANSALFDISGADTGNSITAHNLFIGPEGGFSEAEVTHAKEKGLTVLSLGSLTLRAETAAIAVSFLATR